MQNPLNLNPQVIEEKTTFNPSSNKLTYNFVTDPRLRRGHNFGVVYVTSSSYDNTIPKSENKKSQNQKSENMQKNHLNLKINMQ